MKGHHLILTNVIPYSIRNYIRYTISVSLRGVRLKVVQLLSIVDFLVLFGRGPLFLGAKELGLGYPFRLRTPSTIARECSRSVCCIFTS